MKDYFSKRILFEKKKEELENNYASMHPTLYNRIISLKQMNYLNLIDRTFFLIKLREDFYSEHKEILGPETEEPKKLKFPEIPGMDNLLNNYSIEDHIIKTDNHLTKKIRDNLRDVRIAYNLGDFQSIIKNDRSTLFHDPNLLCISPFLYDIDTWFRIIRNDISKINIQPVIRGERRSENVEEYLGIKNKLKFIPIEIEKRTGYPFIKDYLIPFQVVLNIEIPLLLLMLGTMKFNHLTGSLSFDSLTKKELGASERLELRRILKLKHDKQSLFKIFSTLFKDINIDETIYKDELRSFIEFFHIENEQHIHKSIPDLNFLSKEWKDFAGLLKYLRDKDAINSEVKSLYRLFNRLNIEHNYTESTFNTYYRKEVNLPKSYIKSLNFYLL